MESEFVIVMITAPSLDSARMLSAALVENRLAACVNSIGPIHSTYRWKGAVEESEEFLLLCKTRRALLEEKIIPLVRELHQYEIPEIVALPITAGLPDYLLWISESTAG